MFTPGHLVRPPLSLRLALVMTVGMPWAIADSALAEVRRLEVDAAPQTAQIASLATAAADLQVPAAASISSPAIAMPLTTASTPPAPVINVETLTPAAIDYETAGDPLDGTTDPGTAPPASLTPEFDEADFEPPAPLESSARPETVPFEIEDYIPEPTGQSLAEASLEVATPPDDFIQWRVTAWGGFMTNNDLEESLTLQGIEVEDSSIFGAGISRTLAGGNTVKIEGELNLLKHSGRQNHWEGTAALALRWEWSPSLSIALFEGVSYATLLPEIEDDNNTDESQFLNYLALEIEYLHSSQWGLAGRIHHRSGAYRQFGDAVGGSNAYIFGLRRRF